MYMAKRDLTSEYLDKIVRILESNGLKLDIDKPLDINDIVASNDAHLFFYGQLGEEGFGLFCRICGSGSDGHRYNAILESDERTKNDQNRPIAIENWKAAKEGRIAMPNVPFGNIKFQWRISGLLQNDRYVKFIEVCRSLYPLIRPFYGYSFIEGMTPEFVNLMPTMNNIIKDGPRDFFYINIWGPEVSKRVDWKKLRNEDLKLIFTEFEDGGIMIFFDPEKTDVDSFNRMDDEGMYIEKLLGWITQKKLYRHRFTLEYLDELHAEFQKKGKRAGFTPLKD